MIPNCATQERSAPRELSTATGMMGSEANRVSMRMKVRRMGRESPIGTQSTLAEESPKRNRHIERVYLVSMLQDLNTRGLTRVTAPR